MNDLAIDVRGLRKSYDSLEAVRGIDLQIRRGEVFALLGPNGAGKTTTVEVLEGYRKRSSGHVSVLGHDPARGERAFRERIGIVLQETGIERFLKVGEVIDLYRGYYPDPLPRDEIIDIVGLGDKRDTLVRRLSGGQQRRLDVAVGMAGDPELLFLDEPTTGFDPSARRGAWKMIENLRELGKTVFLTTHYMDEAATLADRVAILSAGSIVAEGTPASLASHMPGTTISFSMGAGAPPLPTNIGDASTAANGRVTLTCNDPIRVLHDLTRWALDNSVELRDLSVAQASLEDVYLKLVAEA